MILLLISTFLSFLSVHPAILTGPILRWLNKTSREEHEKLKEIKELKTEQQKLNMVDNFVQYSKIQRRINRLTESLVEIKNSKPANSFLIKIGFSHGLRVILAIVLLISSVYFRRTPLIYLDSSINLAPFGYLISFPNGGNTVSFHFWIMCCTSVARLIKL